MTTSQLYTENFPHMTPPGAASSTSWRSAPRDPTSTRSDGRKLLDFTCGIGVTNTGHCHPKVVEAIREQAGNFIHAQANIVIHKPMLQLIEELRRSPAFHRLVLLRQLRRGSPGERGQDRAKSRRAGRT
jgi:acetylornithine/succinyldiaminopimelate/putrescine aminotransferase